MQVIIFESIEHLLEKSEDEEFTGLGWRDAPSLKIEELLGIDAATGGAVGAANIVGLNLEPGEAAGLRRVGQHQIAIALVSVGFLGVRVDDNEAGKDGPRRVEQCAAKELTNA